MTEKEEKESEEKNEEENTDSPTANTGEGVQQKAITLIDKARAENERMEKNNERKAELLKQEEDLLAKKALGGRTEAGEFVKPEFTEDEKASRKRIKAVADASGSSWAKEYE